MKKKFITMLTITTMTLSLLVGCGQPATPNTNEDTSTEQNTEVEESSEDVVIESTEEPEVVVDTENSTPEYTYSNTYKYPDCFAFPESAPEGIEGYTEKYLNENNPNWSMNKTHFIDENGNEINFIWEGPVGLGVDDCSVAFNVLRFYSQGEYAFGVCTDGRISPETYDEIKSYDKEQITSLAIADAPYVENGYYDANIGDTFMSFTFEGCNDVYGKGYNYFILDREKGLFYKFFYVERFFDETAMNVINSIDFWTDYTSNEVVEPETPEFAYAYTWAFPEGMNGYTQKFLNDAYPEWSINKTHYVATTGNEMNFTWEGPASLGESANAGEKVLYLYGENCEFRAWTYGYVDGDYESCLEMDKATWTGFAPDDVPYVEGTYYNVETTDDVIKVVFAVENDNYKGYNCYITDSTNAICYQFAYHENIETYDDTRAINVINSIAYWNDYTSEE